jgi:hypothetical protein
MKVAYSVYRFLLGCRRALAVLRQWTFWPARYRVIRVPEEPTKGYPGELYVVEDAGVQWTAVMACPDRCGNLLHMNLLPDTKPLWVLTEEPNGTASLSPSVWRREGCESHFFLRNGRVKWVPNALDN